MAVDWRQIEELPEKLKDGRSVLLWDGDYLELGEWSKETWYGSPGWVDLYVGNPIEGVTHFAEVSPPECGG